MSVRIFYATLLAFSLACGGAAAAQDYEDQPKGPVTDSDRYEELDVLEGEPVAPSEEYDSYTADPDESAVTKDRAAPPHIAEAPPAVDNYFDERPVERRVIRERAGTCRPFEQMVVIDGRERAAYGTACLQPDGAWKIVKAAAPAQRQAPRYRSFERFERPRPYWDDYGYDPRERGRWRAY